MLSKFNINPDNLQRNLKEFKSEFVRSFERKLDEVHNTAKGRSAVDVKYSRKGAMAQQLYDTFAGNAAQAIPLIGPFAATFVTTVPVKIYEHFEKKRIRQNGCLPKF